MLFAREDSSMTWRFKFGIVSAMLAITISAPPLAAKRGGRVHEAGYGILAAGAAECRPVDLVGARA
jgi:hypothetical protein